MDSMDTVRERFAASEQPTEPWTAAALHGRTVAVSWRRLTPGAVAAVAVLGLALALPHLAPGEDLLL